jgi:drug/metabolite transporter (DMT)-like permease
MPYLLALCSAFTAALGAAFQDKEMSTYSKEEAKGLRLILTSLRRPMWWLGMAVMVGSPVFQYLALRVGNLTQVQPMLTCELLFILAIIVVTHHQRPGRIEWIGAVAIVGGLAMFLIAAAPTGDVSNISSTQAVIITAGALVLVGAFFFGSSGATGWARAAGLGAAAATCFAYQAAMTQIIAGVPIGWGLLRQPALYALAVAGISGFILFEQALNAGHIASSRAAMVIVDPFLSVVLGLTVFHDHIEHTPVRLVVEVLGLAILFYGAKTLATSPLIAEIDPEQVPAGAGT